MLALLTVGDQVVNPLIWYRLGLHKPKCDSIRVGEARMKGQHARDRGHDEVMAETFGSDPEYAKKLTEEVLRDGDQEEIEILRRQTAMSLENHKTQ